MLGFRQCAACGKELPEECYRNDDLRCRVCAREAKQAEQRSAAPAYQIAKGVIAAPREQWARELILRLQRGA
jgi:hypothetical protein